MIALIRSTRKLRLDFSSEHSEFFRFGMRTLAWEPVGTLAAFAGVSQVVRVCWRSL
jgi:hypothetical protein